MLNIEEPENNFTRKFVDSVIAEFLLGLFFSMDISSLSAKSYSATNILETKGFILYIKA